MVKTKKFYSVAIDPLALLLPNDVYVDLVGPRPPEELDIQKIVDKIGPEKRKITAKRVEEVQAIATALQKALR